MSRPKLLFKLNKLGIDGKVLMSIEQFLNGRQQRVKIGNCYSSFKPMTSGVPQGSVLGPLLFVIFINDIVNASKHNAAVKLFADDVKSYVSGNTSDCKELFVCSVTDILDWANKWQLPVSFKKSSWGIIAKKKRNGQLNLKENVIVNDEVLIQITEVQDLGVKFNFNLNFTAHIDNVISKAKQRIFLLNKCIISKDPDTLLKGYKVYVLPILDYNSQIWSPQKIGDITKIETIQ